MELWLYLGFGSGFGLVWNRVYLVFRRGHGHGHGVWDVTDDTPWIADHAGWRFCFLAFSDPTVSITDTASSEHKTGLSMKTLYYFLFATLICKKKQQGICTPYPNPPQSIHIRHIPTTSKDTAVFLSPDHLITIYLYYSIHSPFTSNSATNTYTPHSRHQSLPAPPALS